MHRIGRKPPHCNPEALDCEQLRRVERYNCRSIISLRAQPSIHYNNAANNVHSQTQRRILRRLHVVDGGRKPRRPTGKHYLGDTDLGRRRALRVTTCGGKLLPRALGSRRGIADQSRRQIDDRTFERLHRPANAARVVPRRRMSMRVELNQSLEAEWMDTGLGSEVARRACGSPRVEACETELWGLRANSRSVDRNIRKRGATTKNLKRSSGYARSVRRHINGDHQLWLERIVRLKVSRCRACDHRGADHERRAVPRSRPRDGMSGHSGRQLNPQSGWSFGIRITDVPRRDQVAKLGARGSTAICRGAQLPDGLSTCCITNKEHGRHSESERKHSTRYRAFYVWVGHHEAALLAITKPLGAHSVLTMLAPPSSCISLCACGEREMLPLYVGCGRETHRHDEPQGASGPQSPQDFW
jgi:hypothetical protein